MVFSVEGLLVQNGDLRVQVVLLASLVVIMAFIALYGLMLAIKRGAYIRVRGKWHDYELFCKQRKEIREKYDL